MEDPFGPGVQQREKLVVAPLDDERPEDGRVPSLHREGARGAVRQHHYVAGLAQRVVPHGAQHQPRRVRQG